MLRQLERWLHQHIFKVGWLTTKKFHTTTILYYTFFLPGVIVYELIVWLVAGMLDVRAEQAIAWPEKQEIGELRLNFVRISKKAHPVKMALINIAPLIGGLIVVWFIANNILDVDAALDQMNRADLSTISDAVGQLTSATDFWLWIYITFTVANTMIPDPHTLRGWGRLTGAVVVISGILLMLGAGNIPAGQALLPHIVNGLNALSSVIIFIIVLDALAVGVLGAIEALIEWITGDSATFKGGRMIVMKRAEAIALRQQERQRERARHSQQRSPAPVLPSGPPSIYKLPFPIPGPPGQEPVTQRAASIVGPPASPSLPSAEQRPRRIEPAIITGSAATEDRYEADDQVAAAQTAPPSDPFARYALPRPAARTDTSEVGADAEDSDESEESVDDAEMNDDDGADETTYEDAEESV